MSATPNPFNGAVKAEVLERWLMQFEPDEYDVISSLLRNFLFYSFDRVLSSLRRLHKSIIDKLQRESSEIWFYPGRLRSEERFSYCLSL
jgi:hypothetical protein